MLFIYLLSLMTFSAFADAGSITITNATWSGKDVTQKVKIACDQKSQCDYQVSKDLGKAAKKSDKSFSVKWQCDGRSRVYTQSLPHDATDKMVNVKCPDKKVNLSKFQSPTLRERLTDDRIDHVDSTLSGECYKAVRDVYERGEDFQMESIKGALTTMDRLPFGSRVKDNIFYHYTNAWKVIDIVKEQRPQDFFEYIRSRSAEAFWSFLFYMAEDPDSSSSYGSIRVDLKIKNNAVVLDEFKNGNPIRFRNEVIDEIIKIHPATSACFTNQNTLGRLDIYFLAAEDSGVDMIQYYNNVSSNPDNLMNHPNNFHYYQLLRPDAIESLSRGN